MRCISLYPSLSVFLVAERTDLCLPWGANSGNARSISLAGTRCMHQKRQLQWDSAVRHLHFHILWLVSWLWFLLRLGHYKGRMGTICGCQLARNKEQRGEQIHIMYFISCRQQLEPGFWQVKCMRQVDRSTISPAITDCSVAWEARSHMSSRSRALFRR